MSEESIVASEVAPAAEDAVVEAGALMDAADASIAEANGEAVDSVEAGAETSEATEKLEEQVKELKKKLKIKVDGVESEEEFNFDDEDSLIKDRQRAKAYDKRSAEYATLKKQVDQLMTGLQDDPLTILRQMGLNVDELSEKHLSNQITELEKSPEQVIKEKMEKELQELRDEKQKSEDDRSAAQMEQLKNQYANEIQADISSALDDPNTSLPKTPFIIKKIAENMGIALKKGYNVTAKDIVPLVEKQYKAELQEMLGKMPEDVLEKLIGNDNLTRLRKKRLSKRKAQTKTAKQVAKDTGTIKSESVEDEGDKKTFKDFFNLNS